MKYMSLLLLPLALLALIVLTLPGLVGWALEIFFPSKLQMRRY